MAHVFVETGRDKSARTGVLRAVYGGESDEKSGAATKEVRTPCAVVLTRRGNVPNIPAQVLNIDSGSCLVQVPFLDFAVLNANEGLRGADVIGGGDGHKPMGVHRFCALQGKGIVLSFRGAGSQDFLFNVGSNRSHVSGELRAQSLTLKVTPEDVLCLQQAMQCEFFEPPSAPAYPHSSTKERASSVYRTLNYLDATIEKRQRCKGGLLGVIQGGFDPEYRRLSAAETSKRADHLSGFVLSGLGVGESPDQWEQAVRTSVAQLPASHPIFLTGDGNPEQVLAATSLGVDVFDCSYPFDIAEFGLALDLNAGRPINLNDRQYELDKKPIVQECICYCCVHHTRGYLHHLINVHEMLVETLLAVHNLHQYLAFFDRIREAIDQQRFKSFHLEFLARRRQDSVHARTSDGEEMTEVTEAVESKEAHN